VLHISAQSKKAGSQVPGTGQLVQETRGVEVLEGEDVDKSGGGVVTSIIVISGGYCQCGLLCS
jgi:hypothetical protein